MKVYSNQSCEFHYTYGEMHLLIYVALCYYRYTSKMLMAAIDECHRGSYDFIYLPIDFKASFFTFLLSG